MFVSAFACFCGCSHVCIFVLTPVSVSENLFLFVSDPFCFHFCLFLFMFLLLGITVGNPIYFFSSRDRGAKRRPPPKAVRGPRGRWVLRHLGILVSI